jgi:hypothetical protein
MNQAICYTLEWLLENIISKKANFIMINDSKNGRVMITEASVEEIQYAHGE